MGSNLPLPLVFNFIYLQISDSPAMNIMQCKTLSSCAKKPLPVPRSSAHIVNEWQQHYDYIHGFLQDCCNPVAEIIMIYEEFVVLLSAVTHLTQISIYLPVMYEWMTTKCTINLQSKSKLIIDPREYTFGLLCMTCIDCFVAQSCQLLGWSHLV